MKNMGKPFRVKLGAGEHVHVCANSLVVKIIYEGVYVYLHYTK